MSDKNPEWLTWNESDKKGKATAFAKHAEALEGVVPHVKTYGTTLFKDVETSISIREGRTRADYERYRPEELVPTEYKKIICFGQNAYYHIGILRNVIDLMSDFTCQGIRLEHVNRKQEKFYQEWAALVHLRERAERFCNMLYRNGNVVTYRQTVKVRGNDEEKIYRGDAATDLDKIKFLQITKKEIPAGYVFHNPLEVEIVGGELANFVGDRQIKLNISKDVYNKIKNPRTDEDKALVAQLPEDIVESVRTKKYVLLDPTKTNIYHYKKDDWQLWAHPMSYAIFDDLIMLEKMKLADLAALDGLISRIRIFKVGNLEYRILPNDGIFSRLNDMLLAAGNGSTLDLIWGPDIELVESKTDSHQFLGPTKYIPVLAAIRDGLGIPSSSNDKEQGFTNKALELKTLIERLSYGRMILNQWVNRELKILQKALGHRFPPHANYDFVNFYDEAAIRALYIQLVDRDLVSEEVIQRVFGEIPEMEQVRIRRQERMRQSGKLPKKASPYHKPQFEDELKKTALQTGQVTPGQLGIELEEPKPGEKKLMEIPKGTPPSQTSKPKGRPGQGRPKNSKDGTKRKQKRVLPRTSASFVQISTWVANTQKEVYELVNKLYLEKVNKANLRKLTSEESKNLAEIRFAVLTGLRPFSKFDETVITDLTNNPLLNESVHTLYKAALEDFLQSNEREPTADEVKQIEAAVYTLHIQGELNVES